MSSKLQKLVNSEYADSERTILGRCVASAARMWFTPTGFSNIYLLAHTGAYCLLVQLFHKSDVTFNLTYTSQYNKQLNHLEQNPG